MDYLSLPLRVCRSGRLRSLFGLGLSAVFLLASGCREEKGRCSDHLDTICLQIDLSNRDSIPDSLDVTLANPQFGTTTKSVATGDTLSSRPFILEIQPADASIQQLDVSITGTLQGAAVARGGRTIDRQTAMRPTLLVLDPIVNSFDMSMPPLDLSVPMDMSMPADLIPMPWTKVYSGTLLQLNALTGHGAAGSAVIVAAGTNGAVIKGDGTTFAKLTTSFGNNVNAVWMASVAEYWVGANNGSVYRTTDAGVNWTDMSSGITTAVRAMTGRSANDLIIAGDDKMKLRAWDGALWADGSHNLNNVIYGAWSDATGYLIVGSGGGAAKAATPTGMWSTFLLASVTQNLRAVSGVNDNNIWVVGDSGFVGFTTMAGAITTQLFPNSNNLTAVWANSTTDVWAVGASGTVGHFDGTSWTSRTNANLTNYGLTGVWSDGVGVWVAGSLVGSGAIFKY